MYSQNGVAAVDSIVIETTWIEMPDGVRLSADLYKPANLQPDDRLPVLLEYLPYRKTESRARNYSIYSYFLARGYVVARVDFRGTGNCEGRLVPYEYSDIELTDTVQLCRSVRLGSARLHLVQQCRHPDTPKTRKGSPVPGRQPKRAAHQREGC